MLFRLLLSVTIAGLFLISCSAQKEYKNSGSFSHNVRVYNSLKKEWVRPAFHIDLKKWFRDSFVIIEGQRVDIEYDSANVEKSYSFVDRYVFIDLKKRAFYTYKSFADTAVFIKKYSYYDTGYIDDKWNFFDTTSFMSSNKHFRIADTIINGTNYRRHQVNSTHTDSKGDSYTNIETEYLRCDLKNHIMSHDKPMSRITGCFISKMEDWQPERKTGIFYEIVPISSTLTAEESKIFDAWEKNARENPAVPNGKQR